MPTPRSWANVVSGTSSVKQNIIPSQPAQTAPVASGPKIDDQPGTTQPSAPTTPPSNQKPKKKKKKKSPQTQNGGATTPTASESQAGEQPDITQPVSPTTPTSRAPKQNPKQKNKKKKTQEEQDVEAILSAIENGKPLPNKPSNTDQNANSNQAGTTETQQAEERSNKIRETQKTIDAIKTLQKQMQAPDLCQAIASHKGVQAFNLAHLLNYYEAQIQLIKLAGGKAKKNKKAPQSQKSQWLQSSNQHREKCHTQLGSLLTSIIKHHLFYKDAQAHADTMRDMVTTIMQLLLATQQSSPKHQRLACVTFRACAMLLAENKAYEGVIECCEQAIAHVAKDEAHLQLEHAIALQLTAASYWKLGELDDAKVTVHQAIDQLHTLNQTDGAVQQTLSTALATLSHIYQARGQIGLAHASQLEAIAVKTDYADYHILIQRLTELQAQLPEDHTSDETRQTLSVIDTQGRDLNLPYHTPEEQERAIGYLAQLQSLQQRL